MAPATVQARSNEPLWALVRRQHGVVAREQLLELGFSPESIRHRVAKGRLHPVWRGVYAVGRPATGQHGRWMAAVLSCGPAAVLSHDSAAALWGVRAQSPRAEVHVSIPVANRRSRLGIVVHRRARLGSCEVDRQAGIPVTRPILTLLDMSKRLPVRQLEAAVNEADKRDLVNPQALRSALDEFKDQPGAAVLRRLLDRRTFVLTDSELERRFLRTVNKAGLPTPVTGAYMNGFKVDFHWPELGLVVETDGLRYHRTPAQQARDRRRDQAHTAAGMTTLRFTHAQVRFEAGSVVETLARVMTRLSRAP